MAGRPAACKTVILANGKYPSHPVPRACLSDAGLIVCCDGAVSKLVAHGLEPGVIVGDLDSVPPALRRRYAGIMVQDTGQENNDLTKAVEWCIRAGIDEVTIVGATGLREDHTLGNISLLADYNREIGAVMLTDTGTFRVYDRSVTISSHPGQQISLFSLDPAMEISSTGLRYPLDRLKLHSWWRGTLNEADGEQFTLRFEKGQVILFMQYAQSQ